MAFFIPSRVKTGSYVIERAEDGSLRQVERLHSSRAVPPKTMLQHLDERYASYESMQPGNPYLAPYDQQRANPPNPYSVRPAPQAGGALMGARRDAVLDELHRADTGGNMMCGRGQTVVCAPPPRCADAVFGPDPFVGRTGVIGTPGYLYTRAPSGVCKFWASQ